MEMRFSCSVQTRTGPYELSSDEVVQIKNLIVNNPNPLATKYNGYDSVNLTYLLDDANDVIAELTVTEQSDGLTLFTYFHRGYKSRLVDMAHFVDYVEYLNGDGFEGMWGVLTLVGDSDKATIVNLSEDDIFDRYRIRSENPEVDVEILKLKFRPKVDHYKICPVKPVTSWYEKKSFTILLDGVETDEFDDIFLTAPFINVDLPDRIEIKEEALYLILFYYKSGKLLSIIPVERFGSDVARTLSHFYKFNVEQNSYILTTPDVFEKLEGLYSNCVLYTVHRTGDGLSVSCRPEKVSAIDFKDMVAKKFYMSFIYPKPSHVLKKVTVISRP